MRRYFLRKLLIYALTFVVAVTIDWAIPHFMPGNPVLTLMGRMQIQDPKVAAERLPPLHAGVQSRLCRCGSSTSTSGSSLLHGDLGTSILQFPTSVTSIIMHAAAVHARRC